MLYQRLCRLNVWLPAVMFSLALAGPAPHAEGAQVARLARAHHDWARFKPGAWVKVRIVEEWLKDGTLHETRTINRKHTLKEVNADSVTLDTEDSIELGGKVYDSPPKKVTLGLHGENVGNAIVRKDRGEGKAEIEGEQIACRLYEYEITNGRTKKAVTIRYSDKVSPYILERECVTTEADEAKPKYRTTRRIIARNMLFKVMAERMPSTFIKRVLQNGSVTTTEIIVHNENVPRGTVAASSKEVDDKGNLIRRSTLELVGYAGMKISKKQAGRAGKAGRNRDGVFTRRAKRSTEK